MLNSYNARLRDWQAVQWFDRLDGLSDSRSGRHRGHTARIDVRAMTRWTCRLCEWKTQPGQPASQPVPWQTFVFSSATSAPSINLAAAAAETLLFRSVRRYPTRTCSAPAQRLWCHSPYPYLHTAVSQWAKKRLHSTHNFRDNII